MPEPMAVRILIIDDDSDDVEMFCEAVQEIDASIHCMSACNGEEGLRLLKERPEETPDFIFLDLNMPKLNGKQCLVQLKKNPVFCNIPVIIYTTSKLREDFEETMKLGAADFMTKPSRLHKLREAVKAILLKKGKLINM